MEETNSTAQTAAEPATKFCKFCGGKIPADAVICTGCGRQVETIQQAQSAQPQIVINNANTNTNTNTNMLGGVGAKPKNKWVSLCLCIFLGWFGAHKFYEGKAGTGILYLCTLGLLGIGVIVDIISILNKPNPYYV